MMFIDFENKRVGDKAFTTLEECISLVKKKLALEKTAAILGEIPMNESFLREIVSVLKDKNLCFLGYHKGTQYWMDLCSAKQEVYLRLLSDSEERITLPPNAQVYFGAEFKGQISFERTQELRLRLNWCPLPLSFRRELMPDIEKLCIRGIQANDLRYLVPFYDVFEDDIFVSCIRDITRKDVLAVASFYEKLDRDWHIQRVKEMRGPYVFVTRCPSLHRDILRLLLTF